MRAALIHSFIADDDATGSVFDGDIVAVFLYDDGLSAAEVEAQFNSHVVPEPAAISAFLGLGALGLVLARRRR